MAGTLIFLLLVGAMVAIWLDALATGEIASRYSRRLCEESDLQWLDQNVALRRLELRRVDGHWALVRHFRFDVSFDGSDRHAARIQMLGKRVFSYSLPSREAAPGVPAERVFPI